MEFEVVQMCQRVLRSVDIFALMHIFDQFPPGIAMVNPGGFSVIGDHMLEEEVDDDDLDKGQDQQRGYDLFLCKVHFY